MLADPAVLYAKSAQRRCRQICEEIVEVIRESPLTPRRTRALVKGYRAVNTPPGAEIVTPVDYWKYVEFGTSKMDAEPHVRPAIELVRKKHLR